MYRKLEEDKKVVLAADEKTEEECYCTCRKETAGSDEDVPAVDHTATALAVHFDING